MTLSQSEAAKFLALMVLTLLGLAMFQSSAIVTLSYDLEPTEFSQLLVEACETWHAWMTGLGASGVTEAISDAMLSWHEAKVSGDEF